MRGAIHSVLKHVLGLLGQRVAARLALAQTSHFLLDCDRQTITSETINERQWIKQRLKIAKSSERKERRGAETRQERQKTLRAKRIGRIDKYFAAHKRTTTEIGRRLEIATAAKKRDTHDTETTRSQSLNRHVAQ